MLKVAITGPESTGKSWLASKLAVYYGCLWVPEFARTYLQNRGGKYSLEDIEFIAQKQEQLIRNTMAKESPAMFADTELLVCKIWSEFVFGHCPKSIEALVEQQNFDFYLLCNIDLPWEPDPLREHPEKRQELFSMYEAELRRRHWRYAVVSGVGNQRLENAIAHINHVLGVKE
ncbi:MAG TPA: ATP-binding protein [Bacteroidales bacterium]|nr:ATP-binding protein [Bacteroidales bacterium]